MTPAIHRDDARLLARTVAAMTGTLSAFAEQRPPRLRSSSSLRQAVELLEQAAAELKREAMQ